MKTKQQYDREYRFLLSCRNGYFNGRLFRSLKPSKDLIEFGLTEMVLDMYYTPYAKAVAHGDRQQYQILLWMILNGLQLSDNEYILYCINKYIEDPTMPSFEYKRWDTVVKFILSRRPRIYWLTHNIKQVRRVYQKYPHYVKINPPSLQELKELVSDEVMSEIIQATNNKY